MGGGAEAEAGDEISGRAKTKAIPVGRGPGLGAVGPDDDRPELSVPGHLELESNWPRGSGWGICGRICAGRPLCYADLRSRRYGSAFSRILAGTRSAKRSFGSLHLHEWLNDRSLWSICVGVLVRKAPRILSCDDFWRSEKQPGVAVPHIHL